MAGRQPTVCMASFINAGCGGGERVGGVGNAGGVGDVSGVGGGGGNEFHLGEKNAR